MKFSGVMALELTQILRN